MHARVGDVRGHEFDGSLAALVEEQFFAGSVVLKN